MRCCHFSVEYQLWRAEYTVLQNSQWSVPAWSLQGLNTYLGIQQKHTHSDIQNLMDVVMAQVISKLKMFTHMLELKWPNTGVLDMCKREWEQCWRSWRRKHLDKLLRHCIMEQCGKLGGNEERGFSKHISLYLQSATPFPDTSTGEFKNHTF